MKTVLLVLGLVLAAVGWPKSVWSGKGVTTINTLYASSIHRTQRFLADVAQLAVFEHLQHSYECLQRCLEQKGACKAYNFGPANGTCMLLAESVCANESYELVPNEHYNYFDIMSTFDYESKHLGDQYCLVHGKCSGTCYPRNPHFVAEAMTRDEAFAYCRRLGRSLPQPKTPAENVFYGQFGLKVLPLLHKDDGNNSKGVSKRAPRAKQLNEAKYWLGLSDKEVEDFWVFDDGTIVLDSFSAWSVSQPDNGGAFATPAEHCAVMEMRDFNWMDVNCDRKLYFYCA